MADQAPGRLRLFSRLIVLGLMLSAAGWLAFNYEAVFTDYWPRLKETIAAEGLRGVVLYCALYTLLTLLAFPATPLSIFAGIAYGPWVGVAVVSLASTLSAVAAFVASRYLFAGYIHQKLAGHEKAGRLFSMVERHGALTVLLTRLVPLFPYNLLNYLLGLTGIKTGHFILFSWLGMLPGTIIYVAGSGLSFKLLSGEAAVETLLSGSAVVLLMVAVIVIAGRRLKRLKGSEGSPEKG